MRTFIIVMITMFLWSCGGTGTSNSSSTPAATVSGFETTPISGSNAEFNVKRNGAGKITEEGITRDGVKDGVWFTYYDENQGIKTITSYVNGKMTGAALELSKRGQVDKRAGYLNDQLHGLQGEYSFGRVKKEINYSNGKLDGPFAEYNDKGKIQKRGAYKDGQQHGKLEFFDEDENLVMEYVYENGVKVSGGIVEKKETPANQ